MSLSPFTPLIVQSGFLLRPLIRLTSEHESLDLLQILIFSPFIAGLFSINLYYTKLIFFLISKLHIIFGYFDVENGDSFPWMTNQEPLFYFMHGRISDSVASYNYPSRYTVCIRFM